VVDTGKIVEDLVRAQLSKDEPLIYIKLRKGESREEAELTDVFGAL
jgi:hypothetical protein